MDLCTELQQVAQGQCAINIQTITNPGWMVTITPPAHLADKLRVEGDPPRPSNHNRGGPSWLFCKIEGGTFTGLGDLSRLPDILRCFQEWSRS